MAVVLQGLKALYPVKGGLDAVEVNPTDLSRLDPAEFLNDTIIDFYIK
jgi:ubiquitin-like-specific protease 1C/D